MSLWNWRTVISILSVVLFLSTNQNLWAEGYTPPATPEYYHKSKGDKILAPTPNDGMFFGGGVSFGQSRQAGIGNPTSSGLAFLEVGYSKSLSLWSHIEPSIEIGDGGLGTAEGQKYYVRVVLAKIGYSYSLNNSVNGIVHLATGVANGVYEDNLITGDASGSAFRLGYDFKIETNGGVFFVFGLGAGQMNFSVSRLRGAAGLANLNLNMVMNVIGSKLALGYQF